LCAAIRAASSTFAIVHGNGTEAEDLSQDVFLRVYRTLGSYRSAHGGFCDVGDKRDAKPADRSLPADEAGPGDGFAGRCDAGGGKQGVGGRRPDELALLGELSGQVQTALRKLSPELREAVILRDLQQLEYGEIQRVLSVPEGTVKSRINRGRIELARILQQMGVRPS